MAELDNLKAEIQDLKRENAVLYGLSLATGVILTQLLQTSLKRDLNPQGSATTLLTNAREAIEGFAASSDVDPVMKDRAMEAVQQYEEQIRSVLRE